MTKIRALAIKLAGAFYAEGEVVFQQLSPTTQEAWDGVARLAIREVGKRLREVQKNRSVRIANALFCRIGKDGKVKCK
jgi:hypothetical protein